MANIFSKTHEIFNVVVCNSVQSNLLLLCVAGTTFLEKSMAQHNRKLYVGPLCSVKTLPSGKQRVPKRT